MSRDDEHGHDHNDPAMPVKGLDAPDAPTARAETGPAPSEQDRRAPRLDLSDPPLFPERPAQDSAPREPRLTRPSESRPIPLRASRERPSAAPPTGGLFARRPSTEPPTREPTIQKEPTPTPTPIPTPTPTLTPAPPSSPRPTIRTTENSGQSSQTSRATTPSGTPVRARPVPANEASVERAAKSIAEEERSPPRTTGSPAASDQPRESRGRDFSDLPEPPRPRLREAESPERNRPEPSADRPSQASEQAPRSRPTESTAVPPVRASAERASLRTPIANEPTRDTPVADARSRPASPSLPSSREEHAVSAEEAERRRGLERRADRPSATVASITPTAKASPPLPATEDTRKPVLIAKNDGLVVRSIGKQFKKRPVLRDISLRVQRGEAVGLLGPNGAGKTTCFYIITGLIPADFGEIMLDGVDITDLPMYRRSRLGIGYLPQESSIFRGLTVEQNIMAVLEIIDKDRESRETTLEALLAEFSISHLRRTPAVALSGGERRRLEIARALASQPNFVLLDEPLAGIDPIAVRDIRELVSHLKDRGIGVLITDHNVRETLDIVDRAYILHDGNVLMEGAPNEIVSNQEVRRVYLGDRFSL